MAMAAAGSAATFAVLTQYTLDSAVGSMPAGFIIVTTNRTITLDLQDGSDLHFCTP
jgi:hypothetical protein